MTMNKWMQPLALLATWLCLVASSSAGQGRQRAEVDSEYKYETTCQWIEDNADLIQRRSGSDIVSSDGEFLILSRKDKDREEILIKIQRSGSRGDYRGKMAQCLRGRLTGFSYWIKVIPLTKNQSRVTVTLSASSEDVNGVALNVDLRKSVRRLQTLLEESLSRTR
jgi:hypothetical protein